MFQENIQHGYMYQSVPSGGKVTYLLYFIFNNSFKNQILKSNGVLCSFDHSCVVIGWWMTLIFQNKWSRHIPFCNTMTTKKHMNWLIVFKGLVREAARLTLNSKSGLYPFLIDEMKPWRVSLVSMSIRQHNLARPFLTATEFRKRPYSLSQIHNHIMWCAS